MWFEVDYDVFCSELKRITHFKTGLVPTTDCCLWGNSIIYTDGAKVFFYANQFLNVHVSGDGIMAVLRGDRPQDAFPFCRNMISEVQPVESKVWVDGLVLPISKPWGLICIGNVYPKPIFSFDGKNCIMEDERIIPIEEVEGAVRIGYHRSLNQILGSY